jgi:hypothetical protein
LIIATTVACKPQKQIITEKETQVEVVDKPIIHEIYKANTVRDTVWNKDSVFIIQRGDTVYNTSIREFHHYTHTTDTIHSNDTITKVVVQPVEKIIKEKVEVEVEKPLNWWQKFRMTMGDFAMMAIAVLIGVGVIYFVRKQKLV